MDSSKSKLIEVKKDGAERKINIFIVVEFFRFICYLVMSLVIVVGAALTIGYADVDFTKYLKSVIGYWNVISFLEYPPATYVCPVLYAICPITVFLYFIASVFRAWIAKEENKMSGCAFALYICAFIYYFQSILLFTITLAVQPNPMRPEQHIVHLLPDTNIVVGLTLLQYATTWFNCNVSYPESKTSKFMPWINYICAVLLTITSMGKIIIHINSFGGLKVDSDGNIISNGWLLNVPNEIPELLCQINDAMWMFFGLVVPTIESGYLTWIKFDSHGLLITIEDNKMAKNEYEPIIDKSDLLEDN